MTGSRDHEAVEEKAKPQAGPGRDPAAGTDPPDPPGRLSPNAFSRREHAAVWRLCLSYAGGILGLYMVLPVLSPYASSLEDSTGLLVGLAIGIYGLAQTVFQVPFGHLSDRIGRKRTIILGLVLFAAGGLVAASAKAIEILILGRLLQGAGAVTSAVSSLLADLTRPGVRNQAMARLSLSVGGVIVAGVIFGPLAAHWIGVRALFAVTSLITLAAAFFLDRTVPRPHALRVEERVAARDLLGILRERRMLILDGGTMLLHCVVTILFVILPYDFSRSSIPHVFRLLAIPFGIVWLAAIITVSRWGDRPSRGGTNLYAGFSLLALSCVCFTLLGKTPAGMAASVLLYLLCVAFLEPVLPSTTSRFAVGQHRGAAMGVYHMSQFLGTFFGGLLGGAFLTRPRGPLFLGLAVLAGIWLVLLVTGGPWHPQAGETGRDESSAGS
jgi:MFS family permease